MAAEPRFGARHARLTALLAKRLDAARPASSPTAAARPQRPVERTDPAGDRIDSRHSRRPDRRGPAAAPTLHSNGGLCPPPRHPLSAAIPAADTDSDEIDRRRAALRLWANRHGLVHEVRPADPRRLQEVLDSLGEGEDGRYLLEFEDGSCYVDRTDKLPGRLRRHLAAHRDIAGVRFGPDPTGAAPPLDELVAFELEYADTDSESHLVRRLDVDPYGDTPSTNGLSGLVGRELQERWFEHPDLVNRGDLDGERRIDPANPIFAAATADAALIREQHGGIADAVIDFLGGYLRYCLPFPLRTEYDFWTLSGLPGETRGRGSQVVVAALSIGWTEAISIVLDHTTGALHGTLLIDGTELIGDPPRTTDASYLRMHHPTVEQAPVAHHSGRSGSLLLRSDDPAALARLIDDTAITRAAATAALYLMRGRPAPPTRRSVHSPRLVSDILSAQS
ncbi:hypothetical protein [Millisia brevis]|uniref:hypothetical protein n=1 Tax=Millisia brevis TaxID=264148 RepID=UPI00082AFF61|nr:hypothetical protein [Millisia brevis]